MRSSGRLLPRTLRRRRESGCRSSRFLGALLLATFPTAALGKPAVQPIFVRLPGAAGGKEAQAAFEAQGRRRGWPAAVTVDLAAPPPPRAPAALEAAVTFM